MRARRSSLRRTAETLQTFARADPDRTVGTGAHGLDVVFEQTLALRVREHHAVGEPGQSTDTSDPETSFAVFEQRHDGFAGFAVHLDAPVAKAAEAAIVGADPQRAAAVDLKGHDACRTESAAVVETFHDAAAI